MICDECETVAHCSKHGCIPKQPDYEGAIEVSVIFHEGQRMFAVPKQPAQQEPDAIGCKCSECGAWQRWTPSGMVCKNGHGGVPGINHRLYTSPPAQQEPWGFHIQFNNGKDATFKGLDYLAECEAHLEAGETITMLYIKENT